MSKVKNRYGLALALGGGGARGLAHIGVLKVLEREKVQVDLIVGTSMGSIVGAMYAQLQDAAAVEAKVLSFVDDFLRRRQWLNILSDNKSETRQSLLVELSNYVQKRYLGFKALTRISLETKDSLYDPLHKVLIDNNIEDNNIPFAAVCIDLLKGMPQVFSSGSIIDAVYASSAIEGVFPPLERDGMLLADGGPVNITPVQIAKELGARRVIAVDVHQRIRKAEKFANGLEVIMRADNIGLNRLRQIELAQADVVISPNVRSIHWANFYKARECVRRGQQAARVAVPDIRAMLQRKKWLPRLRENFRDYLLERFESPKKLVE